MKIFIIKFLNFRKPTQSWVQFRIIYIIHELFSVISSQGDNIHICFLIKSWSNKVYLSREIQLLLFGFSQNNRTGESVCRAHMICLVCSVELVSKSQDSNNTHTQLLFANGIERGIRDCQVLKYQTLVTSKLIFQYSMIINGIQWWNITLDVTNGWYFRSWWYWMPPSMPMAKSNWVCLMIFSWFSIQNKFKNFLGKYFFH